MFNMHCYIYLSKYTMFVVNIYASYSKKDSLSDTKLI